MDNKQVGKALLTRYLNGTANELEKNLVEQWYVGIFLNNISEMSGEDYERIKSEIWFSISLPNKTKPFYRYVWAQVAAAILVLFASLTVYYLLSYSSQDNNQLVSVDRGDSIKPGASGATLTLADGKQIKLKDVSDGELAEGTGIRISKEENGLRVYEIKERTANVQSERMNVLTTEKGETYMIVLPDMSKVWLNASSKLAFSTHHREVNLEGEGYFEIAKDKRPFIVKTRNQTVQVLGTHFNINAYGDEDQVKTSLLEGKVLIVTEKGKRELNPGQQALNTEGQLAVREVNMESVVAWKNGFFKFEGSLESVMRAIARWYDVELEFAANAPKEVQLWGYVSRSNELETVLRQLERTNKVDFTLEGHKIIVKKANR